MINKDVKINAGRVVNAVYKTEDYGAFELSKFNRNVILTNQMVQQAEEGFIAPIVVNEKMVVIDGQHRLKASEIVGAPVEYIIKDGLSEHDIVRMNTVQKKWTLANHVEAWANRGNKEYIKLLDVINNHYKNTTVVSQIAYNSKTYGTAKRAIEDGEFKFYNYDRVIDFLEYLDRFKEETGVPKRTGLSRALNDVLGIKKIDRDRLIQRVVSTGLDDELKTKTLNQSDVTRRLIDSYNKMLSVNSPTYISYHITSKGSIVIDEEKAEWSTNRL